MNIICVFFVLRKAGKLFNWVQNRQTHSSRTRLYVVVRLSVFSRCIETCSFGLHIIAVTGSDNQVVNWCVRPRLWCRLVLRATEGSQTSHATHSLMYKSIRCEKRTMHAAMPLLFEGRPTTTTRALGLWLAVRSFGFNWTRILEKHVFDTRAFSLLLLCVLFTAEQIIQFNVYGFACRICWAGHCSATTRRATRLELNKTSPLYVLAYYHVYIDKYTSVCLHKWVRVWLNDCRNAGKVLWSVSPFIYTYIRVYVQSVCILFE